MDYSKIIKELKQASSFDLYRLRVAINQQLENPQRVKEIRSRLRPDQHITYFNATENRLVKAKVLKLKRTRLLVENEHDQQRWNIPFYFVNLDSVDTDIISSSKMGLDREQLKVGDKVGFRDKQNNDVYGEVLKLNPKTATILTDDKMQWRVGYGWLYLVVESEPEYPNVIEALCISRR